MPNTRQTQFNHNAAIDLHAKLYGELYGGLPVHYHSMGQRSDEENLLPLEHCENTSCKAIITNCSCGYNYPLSLIKEIERLRLQSLRGRLKDCDKCSDSCYRCSPGHDPKVGRLRRVYGGTKKKACPAHTKSSDQNLKKAKKYDGVRKAEWLLALYKWESEMVKKGCEGFAWKKSALDFFGGYEPQSISQAGLSHDHSVLQYVADETGKSKLTKENRSVKSSIETISNLNLPSQNAEPLVPETAEIPHAAVLPQLNTQSSTRITYQIQEMENQPVPLTMPELQERGAGTVQPIVIPAFTSGTQGIQMPSHASTTAEDPMTYGQPLYWIYGGHDDRSSTSPTSNNISTTSYNTYRYQIPENEAIANHDHHTGYISPASTRARHDSEGSRSGYSSSGGGSGSDGSWSSLSLTSSQPQISGLGHLKLSTEMDPHRPFELQVQQPSKQLRTGLSTSIFVQDTPPDMTLWDPLICEDQEDDRRKEPQILPGSFLSTCPDWQTAIYKTLAVSKTKFSTQIPATFDLEMIKNAFKDIWATLFPCLYPPVKLFEFSFLPISFSMVSEIPIGLQSLKRSSASQRGSRPYEVNLRYAKLSIVSSDTLLDLSEVHLRWIHENFCWILFEIKTGGDNFESISEVVIAQCNFLLSLVDREKVKLFDCNQVESLKFEHSITVLKKYTDVLVDFIAVVILTIEKSCLDAYDRSKWPILHERQKLLRSALHFVRDLVCVCGKQVGSYTVEELDPEALSTGFGQTIICDFIMQGLGLVTMEFEPYGLNEETLRKTVLSTIQDVNYPKLLERTANALKPNHDTQLIANRIINYKYKGLDEWTNRVLNLQHAVENEREGFENVLSLSSGDLRKSNRTVRWMTSLRSKY